MAGDEIREIMESKTEESLLCPEWHEQTLNRWVTWADSGVTGSLWLRRGADCRTKVTAGRLLWKSRWKVMEYQARVGEVEKEKSFFFFFGKVLMNFKGTVNRNYWSIICAEEEKRDFGPQELEGQSCPCLSWRRRWETSLGGTVWEVAAIISLGNHILAQRLVQQWACDPAWATKT